MYYQTTRGDDNGPKSSKSPLKALALFKKIMLLLGPETIDSVLTEGAAAEGPEGVPGAVAVNLIAEVVSMNEEMSVGPVSSRSTESVPIDIQASQYAVSFLSDLALDDSWSPAVCEYSTMHLTADILPTIQNVAKADFASKMRKGAVALGIWGGCPGLPQLGQQVAISSGGSGCVVDLSSQSAVVAANDSSNSRHPLESLSVKMKIPEPSVATVTVLLDLLQWHIGYMSVGQNMSTCGWLGLNQRSMLVRAVSALAHTNPKLTIQSLVDSDLLRPLIQTALKADVSEKVSTQLSVMITEQEMRSLLVQGAIIAHDKEGEKSAADEQPDMKDPGMNPLFTFRKVQLAAVANQDDEETEEAPTLVSETKATMEETDNPSDDEDKKKKKVAEALPDGLNELGLAACKSLHGLVRLHALSAATSLCKVLGNSDSFLALVRDESQESRQADADLVFQLLNACQIAGGSLQDTKESLEGFMANCDAMVPSLLQNAKLDLQASTTIVKKTPTIKSSVWAMSDAQTHEHFLSFPDSEEVTCEFECDGNNPVQVGKHNMKPA